MAQPLRGWWMVSRPAFSADPARVGRETVHASYLHVHWAGYPDLAQRFTDAVHAHARTMRVERPAMRPEQILRPEPKIPRPEYPAMRPEPVEGRPRAPQPAAIYDLHHHGDRDAAEGLVDLPSMSA